MAGVPLKILVTDSGLFNDASLYEQVEKLTNAGHDVTVDDSFKQYDFITGPNCWLLRPEVANLFTLAVTNARKIANLDEGRRANAKQTKGQNKKTKKAIKPKATIQETLALPELPVSEDV